MIQEDQPGDLAMSLEKLALLTCLASTLFMTGLIWFVQVVHYPLFDRVGPDHFGRYHAEHTRRTTRVVLGPMALELGSSLILIAIRPWGMNRVLVWAGLVCAGLTWLSTIGSQVPSHARLAIGFDRETHRALVATNIMRVASWTAHAAVVLVMVGRLLP
jgi:hypothetical protein